MTDRSGVRPELVAHMELRAREIEADPVAPGWDATRARAEITFPQRWGKNEAISAIDDVMVKIDNRQIKIRIYRPRKSEGTILFFHGGGWTNGSVTTHDGPCIMLANRSNSTVVSVNYRKAPEHPFPAAVNDCDAVLDWVVNDGWTANIDSTEIYVAGESAGGNLAAVLAQRARDREIELKGQLLIYPVTDGRMASESFSLFAQGFMLTAQDMENCYRAYISEKDMRTDPRVSPLLAKDFSGLCPTFLATCDHDPLRDEGRAYAAKLIAAGVETSFVEIKGALHGIWIMKAVTPLASDLVLSASNWVLAQRKKNSESRLHQSALSLDRS